MFVIFHLSYCLTLLQGGYTLEGITDNIADLLSGIGIASNQIQYIKNLLDFLLGAAILIVQVLTSSSRS
jgi:hypothetical protein